MIEKSIKIQLNGGLEARPVNAKSILGMLSLALDTGDSVTVSADVKDEQQAIQSIEEYLSGSKH